jgi:hypothetical protein
MNILVLPNALETKAAWVVIRSSRTILWPILSTVIFIVITHFHQ